MYCPLSFPRIVSLINPEKPLGTIPDRIDQIITVTKVFPNQVKKENDQLYLKLSNKGRVVIENTNLKPKIV
jgi:protein TonB